MKRLICAKDMEEFLTTRQNVFYIDKDMILTPSAKDIAKNNNISIATKEITEKEICNSNSISMEGLDANKLLEMFKELVNQGLLQEILKILANDYNSKFVSLSDESGFKVIRGSTVKMDTFDTGNPNDRVYVQELVSKDESKMSAGVLVIEDSKFEWELNYEEIDYVIEGTVMVEINNKIYEANAGDILFVPKNSKVVWSSHDKAKLFYVTYPANWSD